MPLQCLINSPYLLVRLWWIFWPWSSNCFYKQTSSRHFSHVTKSRIFKTLNLRKNVDRNFRGAFLKNSFRHLKLYSNRPSWLARSRCHMGTFWKTKDSSSHFWESQTFRFWYVEVQRQRRLKLTKTGISSKFYPLARPEIKNLVYFLWEKVYIRKFCRVKARSFWFKNWYFPSSTCCS